MKQVYEICMKIANTSSRTEKEAIIKDSKDNQLFKNIMEFVYDPFTVTGLSKKKINKNVGYIEGCQSGMTDIYKVIEYLKQNNTGRDVDISTVQSYYTNFEPEMQNFIKDILTKELKIGITEKTLNEVFGKDFIPSFNVMLAKKYSEYQDKVKGNFVLTQKLDGNRIVVIKEDGVVTSFTRTGKPYEGLEEIESDINDLIYDNIVFDGELIADTEGSTHEVFTETISKARSKGSNKTGLLFHIFDVIPLSEFKKGKSSLNCIDRKLFLSSIFDTCELPHCKEVKPLYIGNDKSQIDVWMQYAREQGWEGIMLNLDKPYECKRTDSILKVKVFQTCDLRCIGFEEGTGQNKGRLGALIVDYKGYPCGVGTGLSEADRIEIWNNQDMYLGKIVELKYFEESKNSDGGLSLRFPVFIKWRFDKNDVSYE